MKLSNVCVDMTVFSARGLVLVLHNQSDDRPSDIINQ